MPIDINVILDSRKVDYDYEIKNNRVYIKFKINNGKKLIINYDFNIYDDFKLENSNYPYKEGYLELDLEKNKIDNLEFSLKVNYKYYIKLVYNHQNFNYNKNDLIDKLEFLYKVNNEKEILDIINILKEFNLDDKFLYYEIDKMIMDILTDNPYCDNLLDKMTMYDLLNLITYNIAANKPFSIDQKTLDTLVDEAKLHEYTNENIWRLAMNYDLRGYDYKKIEEYFVESHDVYYLVEYISAVYQANKDYIVDLLIKLNDQKYIDEILNNDFIKRHLEEKYIKRLKDNKKDTQ